MPAAVRNRKAIVPDFACPREILSFWTIRGELLFHRYRVSKLIRVRVDALYQYSLHI
jgi:hypothetical protein